MISNEDCNSYKYNNYFFTTVRDNMLCAVPAGERSKGKVCKEDFGAPLVERVGGRYELIGVLSNMVMQCAQVMYPAIYAR